MGSLCCCFRTNHASQAQPHNTSRPLSTKLAIAAIVVGSIAFIVLGAIGTAGILHSSGVIQSLPQSFSWIANMGTAAHGVMLGAAGLSIFAIAAGGVKCHRARILEKRTERRTFSSSSSAAPAKEPASAATDLVWREDTQYTTKYAAIPVGKYAICSKTRTDTDLIIRQSADHKIVCCTIIHSTLQATLESLGLTLTKDEFSSTPSK